MIGLVINRKLHICRCFRVRPFPHLCSLPNLKRLTVRPLQRMLALSKNIVEKIQNERMVTFNRLKFAGASVVTDRFNPSRSFQHGARRQAVVFSRESMHGSRQFSPVARLLSGFRFLAKAGCNPASRLYRNNAIQFTHITLGPSPVSALNVDFEQCTSSR